MTGRTSDFTSLSIGQAARLRATGLDRDQRPICLAFEVAGPFDVDIFRIALELVASRHETLRTTVDTSGSGGLRMRIARESVIPVTVDDLSSRQPMSVVHLVRNLVAAEARVAFDLRSGPLIRARVVRLGNERHLVTITLEHLVADGWSMQLLCDDLGTAYATLRQGDRWNPPPPRRRFAEYALWQRELIEGEGRDGLVSYWVNHLDGVIPQLRIGDLEDEVSDDGFGFERAIPERLLAGHFNKRMLPQSSGLALRALCQAERATNFMIGMTAMLILLGTAGAQPTPVVMAPFAARPSPDFADVIGNFVNILPVRVHVDRDATARTLLRRTRATVLDAIEHEQFPYEELIGCVENYALPDNRYAYFDVGSPILLRLPGAGVAHIDLPPSKALFDLSCWLENDGLRLRLASLHRSVVFSPESARGWLNAYEAILLEVAERPDQTVQSLVDAVSPFVTSGAARVPRRG